MIINMSASQSMTISPVGSDSLGQVLTHCSMLSMKEFSSPTFEKVSVINDMLLKGVLEHRKIIQHFDVCHLFLSLLITFCWNISDNSFLMSIKPLLLRCSSTM